MWPVPEGIIQPKARFTPRSDSYFSCSDKTQFAAESAKGIRENCLDESRSVFHIPKQDFILTASGLHAGRVPKDALIRLRISIHEPQPCGHKDREARQVPGKSAREFGGALPRPSGSSRSRL